MARVLVIDDDAVTRTVIQAVLETAGHTVGEAAENNRNMTRRIHGDLVVDVLLF